MKVMPHMIKVCSFLSTVLFSLSLLLSPTAPAWASVDMSLSNSSNMHNPIAAVTPTATSSDEAFSGDQVDDLLDDIEFAEEEDDIAARPIPKQSVLIDSWCKGVIPGKTYEGRWKILGSNKLKCKEGAGGIPTGVYVSRTVCRIVPLHDPIIDNLTITSATRCKQI